MLRAAVGGTAATLGALYLSGLVERTPTVWGIASVLVAAGVALVIGFMTPFASLAVGVCVLATTFSWFPASPFALLGARLVTSVIVLTAVGIGLLGPGAFSFDSHFFGRREIKIPPRTPES